MNFRKYLDKYKRRQILNILRMGPSEKFEAIAHRKLLKAFHVLYKTSPAYRDLLNKERIVPAEIKTEKDFCEKLPILRKQNFFEPYSLSDLLGKNAGKVKLATSSSGFSGVFAYGFASNRALDLGKSGVDTTLDYWFDTSHRKTFLINCAPMGVHVETSLPLAETSVRSDMALSIIKKVSPEFDQTVLVGDPYFLKKLIEEGTEQKVDWNKLGVSLITGQDWLPESLRSYLAGLIGINPDTDENWGIYATMGMTELGLNVFHESKYTVRLRRKIMVVQWLREKFIRSAMKSCPILFHYYPFRTYIESVESGNHSELLFSIADKNSLLPLMRYSTGDCGFAVGYKELAEILNKRYPELLPDLKLPLGIMQGRIKSEFYIHEDQLFIEDIKEGLFRKIEAASSITGFITLKMMKDTAEVLVQLRKNIKKSPVLVKQLTEAVHSLLSVELQVRVFDFHEIPEILDLNYERKFSV
jgi:phenylacetate-CoA ligase